MLLIKLKLQGGFFPERKIPRNPEVFLVRKTLISDIFNNVVVTGSANLKEPLGPFMAKVPIYFARRKLAAGGPRCKNQTDR
jgi:hypothetical protein